MERDMTAQLCERVVQLERTRRRERMVAGAIVAAFLATGAAPAPSGPITLTGPKGETATLAADALTLRSASGENAQLHSYGVEVYLGKRRTMFISGNVFMFDENGHLRQRVYLAEPGGQARVEQYDASEKLNWSQPSR